MKKVIYTLIFTLLAICGLVFANRDIKNDSSKKQASKPLSEAEKKAALKKWEATPDGIDFNNWKASAKGQKILASATHINKKIKSSAKIEAVVSSLSLPSDSRVGYGMMVKVNGDEYILAFGPEKSGKSVNNEFEQLHNLKVNDKILIKSNGVSYAPKYAYPIVSGDYVEKNARVIYKRAPRKGIC